MAAPIKSDFYLTIHFATPKIAQSILINFLHSSFNDHLMRLTEIQTNFYLIDLQNCITFVVYNSPKSMIVKCCFLIILKLENDRIITYDNVFCP